MKTATIAEVLSRPEEMLAGEEWVLITRDGRPASVVYPLTDPRTVPLEVRRKLYTERGAKLIRQLREQGITEEQVERDIQELFGKPLDRQ